MKASIQQLTIDDREWLFFFDFEDKACVEVEGVTYNYEIIAELFESFPVLFQLDLDKAAQVINFLASGFEYQFIENIAQFREEFPGRWASEEDQRFNYGCFDVTKMHPPLIKNAHFIFYVLEDRTRLPYRVSMDLPFIEGVSGVRYELLSYASVRKKDVQIASAPSHSTL